MPKNTLAANNARRQDDRAKVRIQIMINPDLIEKLDTLEQSRSHKIEQAVKAYLKETVK